MRSPFKLMRSLPGLQGFLSVLMKASFGERGLGLPASLLERFVLTRL